MAGLFFIHQYDTILHMILTRVATIRKLARTAERAARTAVRNRFLIETYLSAQEAFIGRTNAYRSARSLFTKLGI
jgi:hypothetical protein